LLIEKLGAGIAVKNFRAIGRVVRELIEDGRLEILRANVRRLDNRAIYEIPEILDRIMKQPASTASDKAGFRNSLQS